MIYLQVEEWQGCSVITESRRKVRHRLSLGALGKNQPCHNRSQKKQGSILPYKFLRVDGPISFLIPDFYPPELWENIFFLNHPVFNRYLVEFCGLKLYKNKSQEIKICYVNNHDIIMSCYPTKVYKWLYSHHRIFQPVRPDCKSFLWFLPSPLFTYLNLAPIFSPKIKNLFPKPFPLVLALLISHFVVL